MTATQTPAAVALPHQGPAAGTTTPRVIGLDLAAEVSGVALPGATTVIKAPKKTGKTRTLADDLNRLSHVEQEVSRLLDAIDPHLVVIEDYAPGLRSAAAHRLAEISGTVRLACHRRQVPLALVNVMHLKIYATGAGGATKSQMATAALSRAGAVFATEDECDAAWLRWLGLDFLNHPAFPLPKRHREVLAKVTWPEVAW